MKISNPIEVCNLALLKINQDSISVWEEDSLQAKACRENYDLCLEILLSQYAWTFALERASLTVATDNSRFPNESDRDYETRKDKTLFEYVRRFSLPHDFLRLVTVYNSFDQEICAVTGMRPTYVLEGGFLLSSLSKCKIKYVKNTEEVAKFSPLFKKCLVLSVALSLTKFFNDSTTYLQQLEADYEMTLGKAKISDCQQTMFGGMRSYPLLRESESF
jgi:hypothetical protein